ncbi:MAG: hypothetical protein K6G29_07070 [Clostridiales bacterium]|nr:hypothetical protein [Clostridiales bacterium]
MPCRTASALVLFAEHKAADLRETYGTATFADRGGKCFPGRTGRRIHPGPSRRGESEAGGRTRQGRRVAAILSENRDAVFAETVYGPQTAVLCDGGIYLYTGVSIRLLNRRTGLLQGLCSDPLCRHDSCIESYHIYSMVSDGDRLYFKGNSTTYNGFSAQKWDSVSFVASYDPESDEFEMLDVWEKDRGSISTVIGLDVGSLYYTKKTDEDTNSLYRIPVSGGRAERLTPKGEFVQNFSVGPDRIYYTTQEYTLKSMNKSGDDVLELEQFICMTGFKGEDFYAISAKDEDGFAIFRNGEILPFRVFAPTWVSLTESAVWYTVPEKRSLGTYVDETGKTITIRTDNGTAFYGYDPSTGKMTEFDCPFAYGVREFCGSIGNYLLIGAMTEERGFSFWIFDPSDMSKAYQLFDYES